MPFVLYTIPEATAVFNREAKTDYDEETIRNRLRVADLTIYEIGNIHLVSHDDIMRLKDMPEPKRGRPPKTRGNKSKRL